MQEQPNERINFYAEFATKQELNMVDVKVDELIRGSAGMAVAVEGLTKAVDKISANMEILVTSKVVHDKIKQFSIKCIWISGSCIATMTVPLLVAHWTGFLKMFFKYLMS